MKIMMNIRWVTFLSVIALALFAWYYTLNQQKEQQLAGLIKKQHNPEYVGNKMNTVVYSPTGTKQYLAESEKVEYYDFDGHTDFTRPLVYLFEVENTKSKRKESWKISADKAKLTKDDMLYLNGNVAVETLLSDSKLQRIETESAVVNLKTQDINSDTEVKINGQNFITTGLKLTGNLQQQTATLKEQVKTFYEITK